MNDFSPYLAEKFVWMLNKQWLMEVPCFSFVVERLLSRPESGMERFLVQIALAMQPAVYVPTERPPALRLYIITDGIALHRGKKMAKGASWGAEDVLLYSRKPEKCVRALSVTYLHVLWIEHSVFERLEKDSQHVEAFKLTKMWATIYAVGDFMISEHRKGLKSKEKVRIGNGPGQISVRDLEQRINSGVSRVIVKRDGRGRGLKNSQGLTLYTFRFESVDLEGFSIVKSDSKYRVIQEEDLHGILLEQGTDTDPLAASVNEGGKDIHANGDAGPSEAPAAKAGAEEDSSFRTLMQSITSSAGFEKLVADNSRSNTPTPGRPTEMAVGDAKSILHDPSGSRSHSHLASSRLATGEHSILARLAGLAPAAATADEPRLQASIPDLLRRFERHVAAQHESQMAFVRELTAIAGLDSLGGNNGKGSSAGDRASPLLA